MLQYSKSSFKSKHPSAQQKLHVKKEKKIEGVHPCVQQKKNDTSKCCCQVGEKSRRGLEVKVSFFKIQIILTLLDVLWDILLLNFIKYFINHFIKYFVHYLISQSLSSLLMLLLNPCLEVLELPCASNTPLSTSLTL